MMPEEEGASRQRRRMARMRRISGNQTSPKTRATIKIAKRIVDRGPASSGCRTAWSVATMTSPKTRNNRKKIVGGMSNQLRGRTARQTDPATVRGGGGREAHVCAGMKVA